MTKTLWNHLLASPTVCGATLIISVAAGNPILAEETTTEALQPLAAESLEKEKITTSSATRLNSLTKTEVANPSQLAGNNLRNGDATASSLTKLISQSNQRIDNNNVSQVTSVSQLSDVQPTDWAFQALQSLVERYGCIAGYPDASYRGNRALTRYEFAAGVNACLDRVNELIATATSDVVTREDLVTLQRLQEEFAAELATLRGRVDAVEAVTAQLAANQFSTTTKLTGEVVAGLTGIVTGDNIFGEDVDDVALLGARTRLNLDTSFTGRDLLRTRLQAIGLDNFTSRTQTFEGNLAFAAVVEDASNDIEIDELTYTFPIGTSTQIVLAANDADVDNFASTVNFLDGESLGGEDGGLGALTRFGTRNPIYYLVEGAGIGIRQQLGRSLELSLGYLADDAGNGNGSGLLNGPYGALAQLVYKPSDRFQIGLTYINSYNRETLTGSPFSNPRSFFSNLSNQPVNINFQPPAIPGTPRFFPANQPIAAGQVLPAGTRLPARTILNAATTLPFPVTVPAPAPISGTITIPAGTRIPAGTALPIPITLPIALTLPAPITLPVALTLPALAAPPPQPIVFDGTLGDLLSQPEFAGIPLGFDLDIPILSNSYGIELSWQMSDNFVLGGWFGYTKTTLLSTGNGLLSERGDLDIINGAVTLAFPNLGRKGNLGGIIVGVEPFVLEEDISVNRNLVGLALLNAAPGLTQVLTNFRNPDLSLHIEAFYQMQLTDNISITPGVIWITAPGFLANNADLVIGTLRTTISF